MKKITYILVIISGYSVLLLSSCIQQKENLKIDDIWARPGLKDGNSAIFLSVENSSNQEDRLVNVRSNIAGAVEIHKTNLVDGVMKMEKQEYVPLPPNRTVLFEPGGLHIMLIGLEESLEPEDEFIVTLVFDNAGEIQLPVIVQEP